MTFIRVMAILIAIPTCYLTYVFRRSVLPITKIVVVGSSVHQVHTGGRNTGCCTTRPLVTTIALGFIKVLTGGLGV